MEVKINIESNQIGETVIDLFKSLNAEKKEELALSVLKEWLKEPNFFETTNREQLLIEEFKAGKHDTYWDKFNQETPDHVIKQNSKFREEINNYKNSKQIMIEEIKSEIIRYYKQYITNEITTNKLINKIKNETFDAISKEFPSIISQVMIQTFCNNLTQLQYSIQETVIKSANNQSMIESLQSRLG